MTMPMCWGNMPGRKTGVVKKGGKASPAWPNIRRDPGWDVYVKSDWATKTNERSIAKRMPWLSEFPGYSERGKEAKRWTRTLYNHPVSSAIDYFVINLMGSSDIIDRESSGHVQHKLKIKVGDNEEAIRNGAELDPIDIEWTFRIFKARRQEPAGQPIAGITKQLNALGAVIES